MARLQDRRARIPAVDIVHEPARIAPRFHRTEAALDGRGRPMTPCVALGLHPGKRKWERPCLGIALLCGVGVLLWAEGARALSCVADPPECPVCQKTTCNSATGRWNACFAVANGTSC